MAQHDPARMPLQPAYNDYVRYTGLPDGTYTGIITLADGDSARFWFLSHHGTDDIGGTLFKFSSGAEVFMSGYFCCEVQLPHKQPASLAELRAFIKSCDGARP
jgi:hypothetical protein